ncbi:alpha-amylase domain-containing protein [Acidobacteriota bacterium]
MGVLMQAFYWDCPKSEGREYDWWNLVREKMPSLGHTGFTAMWLPPISKAANISGPSMGYDPYDYYDLGNINQKGSKKTWFGSKAELMKLIKAAKDNNIQIYADLVINHNSGGDEQEKNELDKSQRWTLFTPKSQLFERNWECFHPSPYETWDGGTFGEMPDLCHRNPYVYTEMLKYAMYLLDEIGIDGFRYDCVKGYGGWMVRAIQELRGKRDDYGFKPFGVGECWDSNREIEEWLDETNAWSDNPASAFDFTLRYTLKAMCDHYGYDMRGLADVNTLASRRPFQSVTFVENHDVARNDPVINDKLLAYAYILTHEGYPCVFWQDYYNWDLAMEGTDHGIAKLVEIHEQHAGGTTSILHVDANLYIMQRNGSENQNGLAVVINNLGDWNGARVQTKWSGKRLMPVAWWGRNELSRPLDKTTNHDGWAELWAPPRGYAVYVPSP